MLIRFKTGPRAGEEVEMKYMDAQPLLLDGRADLAYPPDPIEEMEAPEEAAGSDPDPAAEAGRLPARAEQPAKAARQISKKQSAKKKGRH